MRDGVGGLEAEQGESGPPERAHLQRWLTTEMHERLAAYAQRFLRDAGEAEDIAQETLLRAREGLELLRDPGRFEAWLFRICRHAAIDRVRARRVRQSCWVLLEDRLEDVPEPGIAARDVDRPAAPDVLPRGWGGLALPAHQRVLVRLHYERGCPQSRLCRLSGLTASALRVRLFRARGMLAEAFSAAPSSAASPADSWPAAACS